MRIGHVHLKIRNLQQSVAFYRRYLGLEVTEQVGEAMAFLSAGDRHHELALQEVGSAAASPRRRDVGLYHVAFEVPDQTALADTFRKLTAGGVNVHAVDHRISWALYFSDPDGNGIEVYWDTRATDLGTSRWEGRDRPLPASQLSTI